MATSILRLTFFDSLATFVWIELYMMIKHMHANSSKIIKFS